VCEWGEWGGVQDQQSDLNTTALELVALQNTVRALQDGETKLRAELQVHNCARALSLSSLSLAFFINQLLLFITLALFPPLFFSNSPFPASLATSSFFLLLSGTA
jgi:hypothetical protein